MIRLKHFPKNKDKFMRLIEFLKEILDICHGLGISPVLDGSLAVFVYTEDQDLNVNDVDLACSETEFPKIIRALEERSIRYQLREWQVLQILKDDLKIELDSMEYWYKDLPKVYDILQIDHHKVNMLSVHSLREFYRQGMRARANQTEENERIKYEALRIKYEALENVKD